MTIQGKDHPLSPPLDFSSARSFPNSSVLAKTHLNKYSRDRYARDSFPGSRELEEGLEHWHPGLRALTFRSGMAAIETLMNWAWMNFAKFQIQSEIYRKSELLVSSLQQLAPRQIHRLSVSPSKTSQQLEDPGETFVFLEFPSNPHLRFVSPETFLQGSPSKPFVFIDATMSGLGNLTSQLSNKVDVIGYSLTKFVGGHNDLVGGVLFVRDELYEELWDLRSRMGNIIGPMEAFLCMRSLKTFSLRFSHQCDATEEILRWLDDRKAHQKLTRIFFPGVASNADQDDEARDFLVRRGAVLSFVVPGNRVSLAKKMEALSTVRMAPSFGSVDSLIEICSLMSRPDLSPDSLKEIGLEPTLVRLSVGLEDVSLITRDISQVLPST